MSPAGQVSIPPAGHVHEVFWDYRSDGRRPDSESEGFGVDLGTTTRAEVWTLLVVPPVVQGAFHRPPLLGAVQAAPPAGLSRLAVRLAGGALPVFERIPGPGPRPPRPTMEIHVDGWPEIIR